MMKRSIILVLVLLMLLPVALAGCQSAKGDFTPLTAAQKAKITEAYKAGFGEYWEKSGSPLPVWFDENGGKRDPYVWRYFGTYGDCIVILEYGNGQDCLMEPIKTPYPLIGLSRIVEYPVECEIRLYNTNPNCRLESRNPDYPYTLLAPTDLIYGVQEAQLEWLTWWQLEQLTTDLENWIAEGNY